MQYSILYHIHTRREVVVHYYRMPGLTEAATESLLRKAKKSVSEKYYRMPGLTEAATESLLRKAKKSVSEKIERIETEFCYNLQITSDFTPEQKIVITSSLHNA